MRINSPAFLISLFLCLYAKAAAQEYKYPKMISFEVIHFKKLYNGHTEVYITQQADSCKIEIAVSPIQNPEQIFRKMDTAFLIQPAIFNELKILITEFSNIDIDKALVIGHDGEFSSIKYGSPGSSVEYEFWSPEFETKQRGLTNFLKACHKIIEAAHLQTEDVL